jgi:hypothetical protein
MNVFSCRNFIVSLTQLKWYASQPRKFCSVLT